MKYYIVIPSYNEEAFIPLTLQSLVSQTVLPSKIVVVNDNSTDKTAEIVIGFRQRKSVYYFGKQNFRKHSFTRKQSHSSFSERFETLDENYDFIVKLDADLIFPSNYFETIIKHFQSDSKIGMAGGFCYIEKNGDGFWKI